MFVVNRRELGDHGHGFRRADPHLVCCVPTCRATAAANGTRRRLREADRERPNGGTVFCISSNDGGRVYAARKKCSQWNICDHLRPDRVWCVPLLGCRASSYPGGEGCGLGRARQYAEPANRSAPSEPARLPAPAPGGSLLDAQSEQQGHSLIAYTTEAQHIHIAGAARHLAGMPSVRRRRRDCRRSSPSRAAFRRRGPHRREQQLRAIPKRERKHPDDTEQSIGESPHLDGSSTSVSEVVRKVSPACSSACLTSRKL